MLVADGLGGLPLDPGGKTELETAVTPNLDRLAGIGTSGSSIPVLPGSRQVQVRDTLAFLATILLSLRSVAAPSRRLALALNSDLMTSLLVVISVHLMKTG